MKIKKTVFFQCILNMSYSDFFKTYNKLTVPSGLSKSKEGFFTGVIEVIKNSSKLDKTRALNVAKKWSNILNNSVNADILALARKYGYDDALWQKFAEISGYSYEQKTAQVEKRRQFKEQSKKPVLSGYVKMTVSELLTKDDDYEFYEVTTPMLDVKVEGCYLRRITDRPRRYGFRISRSRLKQMFTDETSVEGEHTFYIEWNYSKRDSTFIFANIVSVNDDEEPTIHPRVFNQRPKRPPRDIVKEMYINFNVSHWTKNNTYSFQTGMFKYPTTDDGNTLYLRKTSRGKCGFRDVPEGVVMRLFGVTSPEDIGIDNDYVFKVTWERVERDGRTRYYSKLAELCQDTDPDPVEEYVSNNTFKRETPTKENVEDNSSAEASASAQ